MLYVDAVRRMLCFFIAAAALFTFIAEAKTVRNEVSSDSQVPFTSDINRHSRPNIIFFLTDDQDANLDSLSYQPFVQQHLINQGLMFKRHYCTVALCCPSRVNLWTGKAAHNTNVTDVNPPYGETHYELLDRRYTDPSRRLS